MVCVEDVITAEAESGTAQLMFSQPPPPLPPPLLLLTVLTVQVLTHGWL